MNTLRPILLLALAGSAPAAELHVGPGQHHAAPGDALAAAGAGDVILVHPPAGDGYRGVALRVRVPRVAIRAVGVRDGERITLSGEGFDFSGDGPVPRAVVQFDPAADGGVLEGFRLSDARNDSGNAAGVRVNGADGVTVRDCEITACDMGVMSNAYKSDGAEGQLYENCVIHRNGSQTHAGYNHNLYLGGGSVTVRGCEISHSTTGHNFKSRARSNRVEGCSVHHAANREFDFVEAEETAEPGSDAVLVGCVIAKDPAATGNRGVIHFGVDGRGRRRGTLRVAHCTIATPFVSPVVRLSDPDARAVLLRNLIAHPGGGRGTLIEWAANGGGPKDRVRLAGNRIDADFVPPPDTDPVQFAPLPRGSFSDPAADDYRPTEPLPAPAADVPADLRPTLEPGGAARTKFETPGAYEMRP